MMPTQLQTLRSTELLRFERNAAALAIGLRIRDQTQLNHVHLLNSVTYDIAQRASEQNLSVFGVYPFRNVWNEIGAAVRQAPLPQC
jgi:hypothetical protein